MVTMRQPLEAKSGTKAGLIANYAQDNFLAGLRGWLRAVEDGEKFLSCLELQRSNLNFLFLRQR
jgi:hypothetical protein